MSLVGQKVGNYLLVSQIGEGTMGEVYLARHPMIGKRVAVKVLRSDLTEDGEMVGRFFQEARAVNEINHPNIVDILDYGHENDLFYFTMEFLEGEDLGQRLGHCGLTVEESRHVLAQCAGALAASHEKGIIHRDLKPQNIFLVKRGLDRSFVKLVDFGAAKLTRPGIRVVKTEVGGVYGTPYYMSPEQAGGSPDIDGRSDIYSLGVVMYELMTGTVPFDERSVSETLLAHMTKPVTPPRERNPSLPTALEAICLRALEKDPARRFSNMAEFQKALEDPQAYGRERAQAVGQPYRRRQATSIRVRRTGEGPWITTQRRSVYLRRRRAAIALITLSLAVAASAEAWRNWHSRSSGPPPTSTPKVPEKARSTEPHPTPSLISVRISSEPADALVLRNGERIGRTPLIVRVPPGTRFEVEVRAPGFKTARTAVLASRDQEVELRPARQPPPRPAVHTTTDPEVGLLHPGWVH